jgi:hypothetical protein
LNADRGLFPVNFWYVFPENKHVDISLGIGFQDEGATIAWSNLKYEMHIPAIEATY